MLFYTLLLALVPSALALEPHIQCIDQMTHHELARARQESILQRLDAEVERFMGAGGHLPDQAFLTVMELRSHLEEFGQITHSKPPIDQAALGALSARIKASEKKLRQQVGEERASILISLGKRIEVAREFSALADEFDAILGHKAQASKAEQERATGLARSLLLAAEELFVSEGVNFQKIRTRAGHEALEVLPHHGPDAAHAARLNQVATGVKARFGEPLVFCPEELYQVGARAFHSTSEKRISLAVETLRRLALDPAGAHEVNHAYHFWLKEHGRPCVFDYELQALAAGKLLSEQATGYHLYMHGSELPAFSLNLAFYASELRSAASQGKHTEAFRAAREIEHISRLSTTLLEQSVRLVAGARERLLAQKASTGARILEAVSWKTEGKWTPTLPTDVARRLDVEVTLVEGIQVRFSTVEVEILQLADQYTAVSSRWANGDTDARGESLKLRGQLLTALGNHLDQKVARLRALEPRYRELSEGALRLQDQVTFERAVSPAVADEVIRKVAAIREHVLDAEAPPVGKPAPKPSPEPDSKTGMARALDRFWRGLIRGR